MRSRRKAREAVLQVLYQSDTLENWDQQQLDLYFLQFQPDVSNLNKTQSSKAHLENYNFCRQLLELIASNLDSIDQQIGVASDRWSVRRMTRVDRNILRIATAELLAFEDIPTKVSINEAIEIAKSYGTDDSPTFINGVLDKLAKLVTPGTLITTAPDQLLAKKQSIA